MKAETRVLVGLLTAALLLGGYLGTVTILLVGDEMGWW